jgi:hypothetical protein
VIKKGDKVANTNIIVAILENPKDCIIGFSIDEGIIFIRMNRSKSKGTQAIPIKYRLIFGIDCSCKEI